MIHPSYLALRSRGVGPNSVADPSKPVPQRVRSGWSTNRSATLNRRDRRAFADRRRRLGNSMHRPPKP